MPRLSLNQVNASLAVEAEVEHDAYVAFEESLWEAESEAAEAYCAYLDEQEDQRLMDDYYDEEMRNTCPECYKDYRWCSCNGYGWE